MKVRERKIADIKKQHEKLMKENDTTVSAEDRQLSMEIRALLQKDLKVEGNSEALKQQLILLLDTVEKQQKNLNDMTSGHKANGPKAKEGPVVQTAKGAMKDAQVNVRGGADARPRRSCSTILLWLSSTRNMKRW